MLNSPKTSFVENCFTCNFFDNQHSTCIAVGRIWANMFDEFYEETRSIALSAEWTFDGLHRCSVVNWWMSLAQAQMNPSAC